METWIEEFNDKQITEIYELMVQEWWCSSRSLDEVKSVIAGSDLALAALDENQRIVAFSRVLTDRIFKAVLFDVIVRADCRGTSLGGGLIGRLKQHPLLQDVKSIELYCPDRISGFYRQLGFKISDSKLHCLSDS